MDEHPSFSESSEQNIPNEKKSHMISPVKLKAPAPQSAASAPKQELQGPETESIKTMDINACPVFYPSLKEFNEKSFPELIE